MVTTEVDAQCYETASVQPTSCASAAAANSGCTLTGPSYSVQPQQLVCYLQLQHTKC